jgi:hypothetical protein
MGPEAAETATGWTPILRELVKKEKFIAVGSRKIRRLGKKYACIKIPIKNIPLKNVSIRYKIARRFSHYRFKSKIYYNYKNNFTHSTNNNTNQLLQIFKLIYIIIIINFSI